ncbi:hypothetical protein M0802_008745 [Mischocyttarus mexicanus]|nr:hypothetical protein M0802_008745 [Mischocyttarus mexicanus]
MKKVLLQIELRRGNHLSDHASSTRHKANHPNSCCIYVSKAKGAHLDEGFYKIVVVTSPVAKLCWEQEVRPLHERPARNFNQTFK